MSKGFIQLPESILEYWDERERGRSFTDLEAHIWLIQHAADQGEVHKSFRGLARAWNWDETKVRRFLARLKDNGFVTTEVVDGKTVITPCADAGEVNQ